MDTPAAAYRLVSAACNLPVLYGKWQTATFGFVFVCLQAIKPE